MRIRVVDVVPAPEFGVYEDRITVDITTRCGFLWLKTRTDRAEYISSRLTYMVFVEAESGFRADFDLESTLGDVTEAFVHRRKARS